jgi:hypothetical protein
MITLGHGLIAMGGITLYVFTLVCVTGWLGNLVEDRWNVDAPIVQVVTVSTLLVITGWLITSLG